MLFWNDFFGAKLLKNHSLVKKKVNRLLIGLGVVVILLAGIFFSLRLQKVQTLLVNKFLDRLEKNYDGKLSVGQVLIRWPHRLELTDLLILDPLNDTLLYASSVEASVTRVDFDRNRFNFKRVYLSDPLIQIREMPDGRMNHKVFLSSLSGKDTVVESKPVNVVLNQVVIRRGAFALNKFGALDEPGRIDWDNLRINDIESQIDRIGFSGDSVYGNVRHLSFQEKCGFKIDNLAVGFAWDSTGLRSRLLEIVTGNSRIESPYAQVSRFPPVQPDSSGPYLEIVLGMDTYVSPVDISLLTGLKSELTDVLEVSGLVRGTFKKARLSDTRIRFGNMLLFEGDVEYDYPSTFGETYIDLQSRNLILNLATLDEKLLSGQVPDLDLKLPEFISDIGKITFSGLFTGTIGNFITSGVLNLPFGEFQTDVKIRKNLTGGGYNFQGSIATGGFNPDEFLDNRSGLSDIDLTLTVDGTWNGEKTVAALIQADIRRITLNSYPFQDLTIKGELAGTTFGGSLAVRDPSLKMDLNGNLDFGKETRMINFDLLADRADLNALNLIRNDTLAELTVNMHGELAGTSLDDITGTIRMEQSEYRNSNGSLPIRELILTARPEAGQRQIILASEYIDGRLSGNIHIDDLPAQLQSMISRFIPALARAREINTGHINDFAFNIHMKDPGPVLEILAPDFQCKDNTRIDGFFRAGEHAIYLEGVSPQFAIRGTQYTGLDFRMQSRGDSLILTGGLNKLQIDRNNQFERIGLNLLLSDNDVEAAVDWNNIQRPVNKGLIQLNGRFDQSPEGKLVGRLNFLGDDIIYNDSLWRIDPFTVDYDPDRLALSGIRISHKEESLDVSGAISLSPADTLFVSVVKLNLEHLNQISGSGGLNMNGLVSGNARFYDMRGKGMFLADLDIDSLKINGEMLGNTTVSSRSGGTGELVSMNILTRRGSIKTLQVNGTYNPVSDSLDFDIHLDKLRMDVFNPWVEPDLREVKGIMTGQLKVAGLRQNPQLNGNLTVQKGSFVVDYLNTRFYFTHPILVTPAAFTVNQMDVQDDEGNHALVSGAVRHDNFKKIRLDFAVDFKDFVLLNADELKNDGYWGRGYATGVGTLKGPLRNLMIDISATTSPKTRFFVPVNTAGEARELGFITYVERKREEVEPDLVDFTTEKPRGYEVDLYGATVNIELAVTPEAEVKLIFDSKVGDVLRARGSGDIRIYVNPAARWTITGDYTIEEGDYQFTLQNMPVKKLEIEPGGTLKWTREITSALLDIDAVYRTKASLYDLLQDETNSDLTQRIPVECHLMMSGKLENPAFDFNIVVPSTSDDLARSQLANLTEEEMNKQIISLLLLNRFMPLQGSGSGTSRGYATAGLTTTTEVLSNQLNYWLSQISKDFDFGFNYRPGDELTSDEVEVALSKQFLNNRMTLNVNGNYDVRQTNANASQLVGDVEVEYKIKPSGKMRVKAFTRANDHLLYEYAPYTQGVGLFYREEFNSFGELFDRLKRKLSGNKR